MARAIPRKDEGASHYALTCSPDLEAHMYREVYRLRIWSKAIDFHGPAF
jgi:hypothetical protein